ncbi:SLAM family member 8 isoform X2 [Eublepharis macularius]|uniref:SLAM family member 8 isoform X2 n=1 Tax=Eublepharis macularius TaxID=481883 RepID=A0AA97K8T3_EUBMA|nr:SLAM family member 8 isoform X2 [Eublepharis macularius]
MGWIVLTLVLHTAGQAVLAHAPVQVLGTEGEPVFLKANVPPGFHIRDTFWSFLTPVEEVVAISFRGTPEILYQSRFYGRSRLHPNFTLEISPVALGDSGTFSALLVNTTGEMEKQIFHLAVYDVVSTPTIRVFSEESNPNGPAGSCELFLACAASRGTNVTYRWARTDGKALARDKHSALENGQVLWAKLDLSEDMPASYSCTVANAVSTKSVTIHVQGQCKRQSGAKEPDYDYKSTLLIVVPLASFLLSAAAILVMHTKHRSGKQMSYTVSENESFPA